MTAIISGVQLQAPAPEARTGDLLDTFVPRDGRLEPDELFVTLNCLGLPTAKILCDDEDAWVDDDYRDAILMDGIRFVSDIGIKCQALGWGDLETQFDRAVSLQESASVEQNLMGLGFSSTAGNWDINDITPSGGAVSPAIAEAMLEGHAGSHYAGLPTLHASPTIGSLLLNETFGHQRVGGKLRTGLGSRLVIGAGYEYPDLTGTQVNTGPDGDPSDAGEMWLYATGEVQIVRSERVQLDPIMDRSTNIQYLRSQRIYVVSVDCYVAAVRVDIT